MVLIRIKTPDQEPLAKTKITRIVFGKSKSFGIIDMTNVNPGKVRSVHRGIAMLDQKQVLVQDEIETNRLVIINRRDYFLISMLSAAIASTPYPNQALKLLFFS